MTKKQKLLLGLILLLGFGFRSFNLNWDQNHHLHPDERFLTMVGLKIKLPSSLGEYLNPKLSPLNPYNNDYSFFVYGTLPLTLTKIAAVNLNLDDYNQFTLLGRQLSVLAEIGVLILVFLITRQLFEERKKGNQAAFWATFFYAVSVLPIQLAHFFAVEPFLVFFSTLSLYLLFRFINQQGINLTYPLLIGFFTGFALACKVTALSLVATIILGIGLKSLKEKRLFHFIPIILIFLISVYFGLKLGDPRIFASANFLKISPNQQFINNLKELKKLNQPGGGYPPAIQWNNTKPIIFPLKNLIAWGLGVPLGILALTAVIYYLTTIIPVFIQNLIKLAAKPQKNYITAKAINISLILVFILGNFFVLGMQFSKNMRYFYLIYPFLAILGGIFFSRLLKTLKQKTSFPITFYSLLFTVLFLIYPVSFLSIYTHPHSRISASHWIYENIPPGSVLVGEHWDDSLPLGFNNLSPSIYENEQLPMFDRDSPEKWTKINRILENTDYIILSSNRVWGSVAHLPEVYPETIKYYQNLFNENLNFTKVAEFTSYPCFPPIGKPLFCLADQSADESFTVYDHPKVIVFKKQA